VTALASVQKKRTPQSTHPEAVAAALAETREWLKRTEAGGWGLEAGSGKA
jgi:hypothetical protein